MTLFMNHKYLVMHEFGPKMWGSNPAFFLFLSEKEKKMYRMCNDIVKCVINFDNTTAHNSYEGYPYEYIHEKHVCVSALNATICYVSYVKN